MLSSISRSRWPWILLPGRMMLFFFFQALFALGYFVTGQTGAWAKSAAWWPLVVPLGNAACLLILIRLYRQEGCSYWDIFRINRKNLKSDLLALLGLMIVTGPVAMLPNTWIATALWGDAMAPMRMFLMPLPAWAFYAGMVLFPVTQGLVELAIYFLYIMPRIGAQTGRPWMAYGLAAFFLGIQHLMIPLQLDGRFILWRGVMFIPFAFLVGAALKWKPSLLPYMAVIHALMDFGTMTMYFMPL